jgi:hypothetical protein
MYTDDCRFRLSSVAIAEWFATASCVMEQN